jgi:hypothetical protein
MSTNQFLIHFFTCSVDLVGAFGPDLVRLLSSRKDLVGGRISSGVFILLIKKYKSQNLSKKRETNLMILINLLLAHVGTVAFKTFHRLIRLKRFVPQFLRELCN